MKPWMALLALAPACGFSSSGDGGTIDAGPVCFGKIVPICFSKAALPTAPRTLVSTDIDTDLTAPGSLCDQKNDQKAKYCVVAAAGLTLPSGMMLTAHGDKPLVLLSTAKMDLLGDIDVSSDHAGQPGPGASPRETGACSFTMAPVGPSMGGGGYGGSLGTPGGGGGNAATQAGGGRAGTKLDTFPTELRGGCKGGEGSALVESPAAGGDGGGAIALVAAVPIHVDAMINASGGGGHGGALNASNGGGGGGAGGMIAFDSPGPLTFGARVKLWANGGGGAQGGSVAGGADGGESTGPMQAAPGGSGSGSGGAGGGGSLGSGSGAAGATPTVGGGGGGGGGAGFIHAPGFTDLNSISPPSSDPPAAP